MNALRPTRAPDELRARTLAAARDRWAGRVDPWTRLWEPRVARLVWLATVALLVAAHLLLPLAPTRDVFHPARSAAADPELAPYLYMPPGITAVRGAAVLLEDDR